MEQLTVLPHTP